MMRYQKGEGLIWVKHSLISEIALLTILYLV